MKKRYRCPLEPVDTGLRVPNEVLKTSKTSKGGGGLMALVFLYSFIEIRLFQANLVIQTACLPCWRVLTGPQRSLMAPQLGFLMAQRIWII